MYQATSISFHKKLEEKLGITINVKADFNKEESWVFYLQILAKSAKFHNAKGEFERYK